jgi:outer membrane scaffolding protein for murein synthesis (MipA/OmpV family)
MKRIIVGLFSVSLLLFMAASAYAGGGVDSPIAVDNERQIVGGAIGAAPDYMGSKNYRFVGAPFFKFTFWGQRYIQLVGTELQLNLLDEPVFRAGFSLQYQPGRDDNVEDKVVKKLRKIDDTAMAGGFVGAQFIDKDQPRNRFSVFFDGVTDIDSKNNGFTLTLSARYWHMIPDTPIDVTLGMSTSYGDDHWMQTYFGIDQDNHIRSGLPVFTAASGIKDFTVSPGVVYYLSKEWLVGAGVRYQRLFGDAAKSPVVEDRGDANQVVAGIAVGYMF